MKVKLLHKIRSYAESLIIRKLFKFTTNNGIVVGLSYVSGYGWAFDWMMGERLDYHSDRDNITSVVARKAWKHSERDKWMAKLRKTRKGKVEK